jgi:tRNA A37 threonylcarbamoyladenosine synthetase subunit TsaC/SUA5/YrdC
LKQGIRADLYLDAGKLKKVKPSTIFDVEERKIIREGPISFKKIMKALKS